MREERKETLQKLCLVFRSKLIDLLYSIQTGHPGGGGVLHGDIDSALL